jgi:hypothetical protein
VKVSVFASKLVNPRGLKFGSDGYLYVAEAGSPAGVPLEAPAGLGGDFSAGANGPGNYFGSAKGSRISRIDANGNVTTLVDNLPSSEAGGFASGVADGRVHWKHDVRHSRGFLGTGKRHRKWTTWNGSRSNCILLIIERLFQ